MVKPRTREEWIEMGVDERFIMDRTTHPMCKASSWGLTGIGQQLLGQKGSYRYPHLSHQSVLITPISNLWEENCWWRLQHMMLHTTRAGYNISLDEVDDNNFMSPDAIGLMRWSASMLARDSGVEWLLMVDTDALLEEDTLIRLMEWDMPIVFPRLVDLNPKYPKEVAPLSNPADLQPGNGLVPVSWAAMSCMLFNVKVFNALDSYAWRGNDHHFGQALNYIGHRVHVDTDTTIYVTKGPARSGSKTYDEQWAAHRAIYDRLHNEERDRHPPPGFDPAFDNGMVDEHGAYFAFDNKKATREE